MTEDLNVEALQHIGLHASTLQQALPLLQAANEATHGDTDTSPLRLMRVVEVQRHGLHLHDGELEHPAQVLPALHHLLQAHGDTLAVGDWVLAGRNSHGQWWAQQRLAPLNELARRLHDGRDKSARVVIVSNVDTALLVMGLDQDYNPRRLERYLVLARLAGVQPVVVLNKADLCAAREQRLQEVRALLPAGAEVVAVSALDGSAATHLQPWLRPGHTLVLLGSSGAGKSTLSNALLGADLQRTGGQRRGDGRGRHTTTTRTLYRLPQGACIIDTPGLRTLRLDGDVEAVAASFDDVSRLALQCRFRDCSHHDEPGCAVRGQVADERLHNYRKMQREAERDTLTALQRRERLSVWKQRSKAVRAVLRSKRGEP